jgi:hypothetical protein
MVLTAYFVLSPATNSSCHRRRRIDDSRKARLGIANLRQLDTSNGCQDHTALPYVAASFVCAPFDRSQVKDPPCENDCAPDAAASTASRSYVSDDPDTPLIGTG